MEYALKVNNLTKNYKNFSLKDISFDLPKGCVMGLIGENGAGKTTTIKLILNIIRKSGGGATVYGLDHSDEKVKPDIGVVLDESSFHDFLKPKDISKFLSKIYPEWDSELFIKYIRRFRLPEDKTVKEYSKGMKTKLSISAALAHNPKLLILDEATGGLDPVVRAEILDIFREFIQDEERSILLSTHITSDLEKIADYITLIHNGSVIFSKSKDELVYQYGILRCGLNDFTRVEPNDIVEYRKGKFGYEVLVKGKERMQQKYRDFITDPASIEDIMLFYVRSEAK